MCALLSGLYIGADYERGVGGLGLAKDGKNVSLTLGTLGKISADDILKYFSYFSQKTWFDTSCKLPSMKTIGMQCWSCFLGKLRKYHQCVVCWISHESGKGYITKTYLYNSDLLKPHFYIVKLQGFTGVYDMKVILLSFEWRNKNKIKNK